MSVLVSGGMWIANAIGSWHFQSTHPRAAQDWWWWLVLGLGILVPGIASGVALWIAARRVRALFTPEPSPPL